MLVSCWNVRYKKAWIEIVNNVYLLSNKAFDAYKKKQCTSSSQISCVVACVYIYIYICIFLFFFFNKTCFGNYIARSTVSIVFIHAMPLPHLSRRGQSASGGCHGWSTWGPACCRCRYFGASWGICVVSSCVSAPSAATDSSASMGLWWKKERQAVKQKKMWRHIKNSFKSTTIDSVLCTWALACVLPWAWGPLHSSQSNCWGNWGVKYKWMKTNKLWSSRSTSRRSFNVSPSVFCYVLSAVCLILPFC